MATAGAVSVNFNTYTAGLVRGISIANSALAQFSTTAANGLNKVSKAAALAGRAMGGLKTVSKGLKVFAGISAAATAAGIAVAKFGFDSAQALTQSANAAAAMGVGVQNLTSWQSVAVQTGGTAQALQSSMAGLGESIKTAVSDPTSSAAMALQGLGLSAEQLANLPVAEQFNTIRDAISGIQDPTERSQAALDIMGTSTEELRGLFGATASEIAVLQAQAANFGNTVTEFDSSEVDNMWASLGQVQALFEGIGTQIAVQVAPLVSDLASRFVSWATTGTTAADMVKSGMYIVQAAIGFVADRVQNFQNGLNVLTFAFTLLKLGAITALAAIVQGLTDLLSLVGISTQSFADSLNSMRDEAAKGALADLDKYKKEAEAPPSSESWNRYFADLEQKSKDNRKKFEDDRDKLANQPPKVAPIPVPVAKLPPVPKVEKKKAEKKEEAPERKLADIALKGSQNARDVILRTRLGRESEADKVGKEQLSEIKQTNKLLTDIAAKPVSGGNVSIARI